MNEYIYCRAKINNMPESKKHGYMVVRRDADSSLWYYGTYSSDEKAYEVAVETGNGIVLEV